MPRAEPTTTREERPTALRPVSGCCPTRPVPGTGRPGRLPLRQRGDGPATPPHRARPAPRRRSRLRRGPPADRRAGEKAASWRPFQLAFVLLNLPSLTDPGHPERAADDTALVDLLFFPTGGGKTEAYLGLTAYTFAIRRLQRTLGTAEDARDGMAGVAVLMRYTLRLLTAQQFQRAAALVCAAEVIRRNAPATWGDERFRIGLWVGAGVSPNWFDDAKDQVIEARDQEAATAPTSCRRSPAPGAAKGCVPNATCTSTTTGVASCSTARAARRCLPAPARSPPVRAPDPDRRRGDLPVRAEPRHRHRRQAGPAALEGLRQILFGRTRSHCDRHGFRHDDLDDKTGCASKHNKKGAPRRQRPARRPAPPARPDHPGRAAPHLRRARHDRRPVRGGRRGTVVLAPPRKPHRPEDRRVHRHHQARPRAGPRRLRPRAGRVPAAGHRRRRYLLLPAGTDHEEGAGTALPGHLRARRPHQVRRDQARRDPAARRADALRQVRRTRRPVHDDGRLLQRHPGTGRYAAVPGRRRDDARPPTREGQGAVRPDRAARRHARHPGVDVPHLVRRHQRRAQAAGTRLRPRPRHEPAPRRDRGRHAAAPAGTQGLQAKVVPAHPLAQRSTTGAAPGCSRWTWCSRPPCSRSAWTCPASA